MSPVSALSATVRGTVLVMTALAIASPVHAGVGFLEPEQAFQVSARAVDARHIEVRFEIAPGYYLYRERMGAQAEALRLTEVRTPAGKFKYDETCEKQVEYYRDAVVMKVTLERAVATPFRLNVMNQGCADKGLCYAPQTRGFQVEPGVGRDAAPRLTALRDAATSSTQGGGALAGALRAPR